MSMRKRFLLLGSISLLLLAGLALTFSSKVPLAHAASLNKCPPTQKENDSGNNTSWVEVAQFKLNALRARGVISFSAPLSIDGDFGSKTEAAVVAFQNQYSGDTTGALDSLNWSSLGFCVGLQDFEDIGFSSTHTNCPSTVSNGSSGIFVYALQDMLNVDYANSLISDTTPDSWTPYLASDGSFGSQTKAAVVDLQHKAGLTDDGTVGPKTWSEMGMCY